MKRSQSSNGRQRTRFSRSASAAASPGRKSGWKMSIAVIAGGTLLLVSVFLLQARLGGFGSRGKILSRGSDEAESAGDKGWIEGDSNVEVEGGKAKRNVGEDALKVKVNVFGKNQRETSRGEAETGTSIDMTDLEEGDVEFDGLDKVDGKLEDPDDDDMEGDDSGIEDIDILNKDPRPEDEDEDEDESEDRERVSSGGYQEEAKPKAEEDDKNSNFEDVRSDSSNNKTQKRLERLGQIKTLPRRSPDDEKSDSVKAEKEKEKEKYIWDRVLGIMKVPLKSKSTPSGIRKLGMGKTLSDTEGSDSDSKVFFSSDDELMDGSLGEKVPEVVDVEDALLLRKEKPLNLKVFGASTQKLAPVKNVFDTKFARKIVRPPFDPSNPTGNFLLQDPDTVDTWGLTKSDKAISKVLRKASEEMTIPRDAQEKHAVPVVEQEVKSANGRKELLETHASDSTVVKKQPRSRIKGDNRKWGYFPGLDPMLSFSEFMEQFLGEDGCQVYVFMAWNSPPWSYTVRHQRGLESVLSFHPKACVTVFSETMELDFFNKFVQKGYRVAVVRPNLEEFLEGTPAEIFASVWLQWRKVNLFYIHYSELLRLAALYKYGGIYLDSDLIVLKPLDTLHNAVGTEVLADGKTRLNGAVMAFQKASPFIRDCLEEFTATYDDKLMEWNGADLITRVAESPMLSSSNNKTWKENPQELRIFPPIAFFPLSSTNISSYLYGPITGAHEATMAEMLEKSYTLHLWNRATGSFVPESNSVVGKFLERHCIWCSEVI